MKETDLAVGDIMPKKTPKHTTSSHYTLLLLNDIVKASHGISIALILPINLTYYIDTVCFLDSGNVTRKNGIVKRVVMVRVNVNFGDFKMCRVDAVGSINTELLGAWILVRFQNL